MRSRCAWQRACVLKDLYRARESVEGYPDVRRDDDLMRVVPQVGAHRFVELAFPAAASCLKQSGPASLEERPGRRPG